MYTLILPLMFPYYFISAYFREEVEKIDFDENVVSGEVMNEEGEVVGVVEGDAEIYSRMGKYFMALYGLGLVSLLIFPLEREGLGLGGYIMKSFYEVIWGTLIFGIAVLVYRKFKYKHAFPNDKRYLLIDIWKTAFYIYGILVVLLFIFALIIGTL